MPKGIDPKAYAARITRAKKIVASMDPATKAKIKNMYPKITKEEVANQALNTKKANMKKSGTPRIAIKRSDAKPVPLPTPPGRPRRGTPVPLGTPPAKPTGRRTTMPKTTKKAAAKPQVAKRAPLQTKRIGGVFAVPVKPKKTIY